MSRNTTLPCGPPGIRTPNLRIKSLVRTSRSESCRAAEQPVCFSAVPIVSQRFPFFHGDETGDARRWTLSFPSSMVIIQSRSVTSAIRFQCRRCSPPSLRSCHVAAGEIPSKRSNTKTIRTSLPQVPLGAKRRASGRRGSRMPRSYRRLESDDAFADRRSASVSEEGIPRGSRAPTRRPGPDG
jgi:hypothetical protein